MNVLATICQGVSVGSSLSASCTDFELFTVGVELFKAFLSLEWSNLSCGGS